MPRLRLSPLLVFLALAALVFAFPAFTALLTDWWWFREVGYQVVFTRQLVTRGDLFLAVFAVTAVLLHLNLRIAQRGIVINPVVVRVGPTTPELDVSRAVRRLSPWVVLVIAFLMGVTANSFWDVALLATHRTAFGVADPVFSRDVGFYVFTLPALSAVLSWLFGLALVTLLLLLAVYALRGDIIVRPRAVRLERTAGVHVAALLAVLLIVSAVQLWIVDSANLLYSTTGPLVGASYTDLKATLPALRVCAVVAVAAAALVVVGALRGRLPRYTLFALGGYAVVAVLGRGAFRLAAPPHFGPAGARAALDVPVARTGTP